MGSGFEKLKDLLSIHVGERRGFILLVVILLLLSAGVVYLQVVYRPPPKDMTEVHRKMEAWLALRNAERTDTLQLAEPFPFDPNTIERDQWKELGFTDRQVDGFERFMLKGGKFRTKSDMARMYSIRPEQFARLEPFILLPDSLERRSNTPREQRQWPKREEYVPRERTAWAESAPRTKVELNSADSATLVALPGIGPSFARGILKYRNSLGGYLSMEQLSEVYVLRDKPDAVQRLKELLTLDPARVKRIALNTCTVEDLAAHPYARWKVAKPLIAYRTQHGAFASIEAIKSCHAISDSVYLQLAPYLELD